MIRSLILLGCLATSGTSVWASGSHAHKTTPKEAATTSSSTALSPEFLQLKGELKKSINYGMKYLRYSQKGGTWLNHPGVTSLCLQAILSSHRQYRPTDGPWVREPIEYLLSMQQSSGAFYDPKSKKQTRNYNTALAILALAALDDVKYKSQIEKAQQYLVEIQCDEGERYDKDKDYFYGGIGYGGDERPDLSNLQLALEALKASGLPKDHPAFQKALVFVQRCHDVEGNEMEWVGASGGFAYSPDLPSNNGLPTDRSGGEKVVPYGSMTFAGLKSLIFCNLEKSDPRVQRALTWVGRNFSVEEHPNFGQNSIYYYFQTMAKALDVANIHMIKKEDGSLIDWKVELAKALIARQREDGSWVNSSKKYMEGVPDLCTAYALNALNVLYAQY